MSVSGRLSSSAFLDKLGNQSQKLVTGHKEWRWKAGFKRAMLIGSEICRVPEPGTALSPAGSLLSSPSSPVVTYFSMVWKRRSKQAMLKTERFQEPRWEVQKYLPAHRQLSGQAFLIRSFYYTQYHGVDSWNSEYERDWVRINTWVTVNMLLTFFLLISLTV